MAMPSASNKLAKTLCARNPTSRVNSIGGERARSIAAPPWQARWAAPAPAVQTGRRACAPPEMRRVEAPAQPRPPHALAASAHAIGAARQSPHLLSRFYRRQWRPGRTGSAEAALAGIEAVAAPAAASRGSRRRGSRTGAPPGTAGSAAGAMTPEGSRGCGCMAAATAALARYSGSGMGGIDAASDCDRSMGTAGDMGSALQRRQPWVGGHRISSIPNRDGPARGQESRGMERLEGCGGTPGRRPRRAVAAGMPRRFRPRGEGAPLGPWAGTAALGRRPTGRRPDAAA